MLEGIKLEIDSKKWKGHPRVEVGGKARLPESEHMTEEMLLRRNFRMNKPFIPPRVYFNHEATKDTIRHFAEGIGDTNPLFRDEQYAKKTTYGGIVAPGCFLYTHQWTSLGGGFSGVHAWYVGGSWEWYRPIREGTKLSSAIIIRDLVTKKGRMAGGGNIYIDYGDVVYSNAETKEILGKELYHTVWAERGAASGAKKEFGKPAPAYSREDWLKLLELYDKEEIRGAKPRHWEDVQVGDKVGPMIKGPLTVRDELAWLMGGGSPFFKAHRIEFDYERRHPKVLEYVEETGEADVPELVHFLDQFARGIGVERAYDYGNQRMSWLCNLFTNWMGDDAFLWKMSGDERVFNQMGDLTIFEGKVTKKYLDAGRCCVDIEAWAKNQKNEMSMPPNTSTVILPSKQYGPVKYADPPKNIVEDLKKAKPLDDMIKAGIL